MTRRLIALIGFVVLAAVATAGCAHNAESAASSATTPPVVVGNEARGAEVFRANCAVCHAANGAAGGVGPSLEHEKQRKNYDQTVAWVEQPDPPMPKLYPASLSEKDVEDVAAYVQSI